MTLNTRAHQKPNTPRAWTMLERILMEMPSIVSSQLNDGPFTIAYYYHERARSSDRGDGDPS